LADVVGFNRPRKPRRLPAKPIDRQRPAPGIEIISIVEPLLADVAPTVLREMQK
jgi:hypothetical protein